MCRGLHDSRSFPMLIMRCRRIRDGWLELRHAFPERASLSLWLAHTGGDPLGAGEGDRRPGQQRKGARIILPCTVAKRRSPTAVLCFCECFAQSTTAMILTSLLTVQCCLARELPASAARCFSCLSLLSLCVRTMRRRMPRRPTPARRRATHRRRPRTAPQPVRTLGLTHCALIMPAVHDQAVPNLMLFTHAKR